MTGVKTTIHFLQHCILKRYFMSLLLILLAFQSMAKDNKPLFETANSAYKTENYALAEKLYDSILKSGVENATVHYNLGNCYFKTNQIGKSILHYEKALVFEPEDEDVLFNLKLANSKIADHIISVPELKIISWWNQFVRMFNSSGWGIFAITFAWVALVFFALYLFTGFKATGIVFGILFTLLSLGALFFKNKVSHYETTSNTAILTAVSAYVKSAPNSGSTDIFLIHEGLKVEVKDKVDNWYKIRLSDGKSGWVEKEKIAVI